MSSRSQQRDPYAGTPLAGLTPRQAEVALLVAHGLSNAAIADRLCVTEQTVRNHLLLVFRHLGIRYDAERRNPRVVLACRLIAFARSLEEVA